MNFKILFTVVLVPFFIYAQLPLKFIPTIQQKQNAVTHSRNIPISNNPVITPNSAEAIPAANNFYVSRWSVNNKYISHLFSNPATNTILHQGLPDIERFSEGTMDEQNNWWGISWSESVIYKVDISNGNILDRIDISEFLVGGWVPMGIAFNPADKFIYFVTTTGVDSRLYKLSTLNNSIIVSFVQTYPGKFFYGLGCSRSGDLYTIIPTEPNSPLAHISYFPALVTEIGTGLDQAGVLSILYYMDLEFDTNSNKCYLISGNFFNNQYIELREVNLTTGLTSFVYDFTTSDWISGLAFNVNLKLIEPELNALLYANQNYEIKWIGGGAFNILLEFSSDNGASWSTIGTNISATNSGYTWTVPQINSTQCLVRATNLSNHSMTSTSPLFRILKPFQFINGNGGERYPVTSQQQISWTVNASPFLTAAPSLGNNSVSKPNSPPDYLYTSLEYSAYGRSGPWTLLASSIPSYFTSLNTIMVSMPGFSTNTGVFKLSSMYSGASLEKSVNGVPNETNSDDVLVVYSDDYWSTYLNSTNGDLLVTDPNGGEKLSGGSYYFVKWRRYSGVVAGQIALEFSSNGGQTWTKINAAPLSPALMRYSWLLPKINSTNCLVRIVNYLTGREYDRSNKAFTITSGSSEKLSNFPNPFNPATKIYFSLERGEVTSLKIFNSLGQEVKELLNKQLNAGFYEYEFNAGNLPSGIYYYELRSGSRREINKMMLVK